MIPDRQPQATRKARSQVTAFITGLQTTARWRRHERFVRLLETFATHPTILDVGGTAAYWQDLEFPPGLAPRITLLNSVEQEAGEFPSVIGDARELSRFNDRQFDIVFSNSVIGHVGSSSDQRSMAREVLRVGRHFFLQTPNHAFPVDWRTLVPLFHFLPVHAQAACFSHLPVGRYKRAASAEEALEWATRIRNLRRRDVDEFFPGASVIEERLLGLTKSFMIHNFPS
jgi:SAM-dependent methyltransferase